MWSKTDHVGRKTCLQGAQSLRAVGIILLFYTENGPGHNRLQARHETEAQCHLAASSNSALSVGFLPGELSSQVSTGLASALTPNLTKTGEEVCFFPTV